MLGAEGKVGNNWLIKDGVKYCRPMNDSTEVRKVLVTGSAGRVGQAVVLGWLIRRNLVASGE